MKTYLPAFLAASLLLSTPAIAQSAAPAHRPGRLPETARPEHYRIHLKPDAEKRRFAGEETIRLRVDAPTSVLVLSVNGLKVKGAKLDGKVRPTSVSVDPGAQTLTLRFAKPLKAGVHALSLAFAGEIGELPQGLFAMPYKDGGQPKVMLSTELEPSEARRIFPLWDEPAYRASFELSVDAPKGQTAYSNMPVAKATALGGGRTRFQFKPTPKMASYLFVMCMGELERIHRDVAGVDVGVVTTRGKKERGRFALDVVSAVLPYYNDYFGVRYPLPKLDLIATPGGFGGAMENWGGITFFEPRLLFDPKRSSLSERQDVFATISHELAHQWFGNLVTMTWWDDLWLNEGFASWMEVKATDHVHPEWSPWLQDSMSKVWTLRQDAQPTTHPIQMPVVNSADAESAFDEITYGKGQAVIRMLESYLGPDAFRDGVRGYMRAHAYGNARTADLWRSLETATRQPVGRVAADWTARPGFPLVSVGLSADGAKLTLAQTRFMADGAVAADAPWPVPVVYTAAGRPATVLFDQASAEVPFAGASGPVVVNAGATGYYRVRYDRPLFERQRAAFATLSDADRATLLADTWALVQSNGADAADFLALVDAIGLDAHPTVWEHALTALSQVRRLAQGTPGEGAFDRAVVRRLAPLAARLGWTQRPGESAAVTQLRPDVLALLGASGDPAVLAEAKTRFHAFLKSPSALDNDVRSTVMHLVGRCGSASEFDALLALAERCEDVGEQHRYYDALASTLDPTLARRVLALSTARTFDPTLAIRLVGRVSEQHPALLRAYFKQHAAGYLAGRTAQGKADAVTHAYAGCADAPSAADLEAYARATVPAEAMAEVRKAATRIRFDAGLKDRLLPAFDAWAASH